MTITETIVATLNAYAPLTALVGSRISPLIKSQDIVLPAITLQRVSSTPVNALNGPCNLDGTLMQLSVWSARFADAIAIAAQARAALEAAGHTLESEIDAHDEQVDEGIYSIIQQYYVWLPPG